jgi:tetratricopeptide (TPR) repeat protein
METKLTEIEREALILTGHIFLKSGKMNSAISVFEGLEESAPDNPAVLKNLAYAYIYSKRYSDALKRMEKYLTRQDLTPRDRSRGVFMKANALWGMERAEECRKAVEEFIALRSRLET